MHVFRKLVAVSAAAVVAMASGVTVAQANLTPSVYNTPGGQFSAGRLWNTDCEKYSSNVVRCRTNIWATQISYVKGKFVSKTGWVFNNLSYLPSPRAAWAGNNLARNNDNWNSGGRKWRTECDTATTGRGGCRSYVWSKRISAVKAGSGYRYVNKQEWVFNNLVMFSSPTLPPVLAVPPHILDQSRLSFTGLGPLQRGTKMSDLKTLGYLDYPSECGNDYNETAVLQSRGIDVWHLNTPKATDVMVSKPGIKTVDGAEVGMTYAAVKALYGNAMVKEVKNDLPGGDVPVPAAVVKSGGSELVFLFDYDAASIKDTDIITVIVARKISKDLYYDGC
ncbi:MAG: hypothetical protein Q4P15_02340 [Propionibacteriaceae bacterium]|nr:hypothetical protein [Propionibacteriaceae bacterium]